MVSRYLNLRRCITLPALIILTTIYAKSQTDSFNVILEPQPSLRVATQTAPHVKTSLEREFFKNLLKDQRAIWTSPLHLHGRDTYWLAPLAGGTAALIMTDRQTAEESAEFSNNPTRLRVSRNISRIGAGYVDAGVAGAFYLVGRISGDEKSRETGLLVGEALIDSTIVVQSLKLVTQRPRPQRYIENGAFFEGGNSFPSGHSIAVWSAATVIASEYSNHRIVPVVAYSLASLVSVSRYTSSNHFPSDVLVGSSMGYGIGRYVYRAHHAPGIDEEKGRFKTITSSKLFPVMTPEYSRSKHEYGMAMHWRF